ncbi:ATP-binding cassette domain-containing protein [Aestuariibius insulae]|uniref:ATP-binding cassette domain-containing protein n=1 Tax=Aestuariibius insulae TaxID=2058287 RepID=UPI00345EF474
MANGLTLENIEIWKGDTLLVAFDDTIHPGEVFSVMGPSGSGKSTLLAYLTGTLPLEFKAQGRVILNGRDVTDLPTMDRRIGLLFQDDLLFPHMSVFENLAFGLRPGGTRTDRSERVRSALRAIDLPDAGDRDPATLSGGQKARVSLMRMLLSEPEAVLLDEPFSKLDSELRDQIRTFVFDMAVERALPVMMVTHEPADVQAAPGRILDISASR